MIKTLFILLFIIPVLSFSQNNELDANGKKHGRWVGVYPNTTAASYNGVYDHGKRVGVFTYYHQNGKVKAVMTFSKNGTFAKAEMYYEDGTLIARGNYINEKKDSIWTYYGGSKNVRRLETWKLGKLDGTTRVFYEPQEGMTQIPVYQVINYKDSVLHGEVMEFYLSGAVKMKGKYVDGNFDGEVNYFYEDGKKMKTERYQHAVRHGLWLFFNPDGTLNKRKIYDFNRELKGKEFEKKLEELKNG